MRIIRSAVPLFVVALAGAALALAGPAQITTTGTLVSKGAESLVVRIDDGGHRIAFAVDGSTVLPDGLAAGRRVSVTYHPTGSTGQKADSVTLLDDGAKARGATSKPRAKPGTKGASD